MFVVHWWSDVCDGSKPSKSTGYSTGWGIGWRLEVGFIGGAGFGCGIRSIYVKDVKDMQVKRIWGSVNTVEDGKR